MREALGKGELGCEFTRRMSSDIGVNFALTEELRAWRPGVEMCLRGGSRLGGLKPSGRKFSWIATYEKREAGRATNVPCSFDLLLHL